MILPEEEHRDLTMTASGLLKIGIGAIVREAPAALLEWIAYHRVVGVENFWIADNGCEPSARQLLQDLDRIGVINYIPFPLDPDRSPQLPAYTKILNSARSFKGVLAFIDADEFLVPDGDSLRPCVEKAFSDETVSALALNWACFGSSGQLFSEDSLVIERFTRRAPRDFSANHHFKSMVRPERVNYFANPHFAILHQGRYVDATGRELKAHPRHGGGLSTEISWTGIRVNHYIIKSLEEFLLGKYIGGSAATPNLKKQKKYFLKYDQNDEECLLAARFAPQVLAEISRLTSKRSQLPCLLRADQLRLYRSPVRPEHLQWQVPMPGTIVSERHVRTFLPIEENVELHRLLEELSIYNERLFSSYQYRFSSAIGSLIRFLLRRPQNKSFPEIRIRRALEQFKQLKKRL
jgi:hypothetical protein